MTKPTAPASTGRFEIRALAQDVTEILIYGDIGESWYENTVSAAQFVRDLQAVSTPKVTVRINSLGGSVPDGIAIHNALSRYPGEVTVEIDGVALSMASLIAMAGKKTRMAENAMLMVHAPWLGYTSGNASELRDQADMLDTFAAAMATSYSRKSGMSNDDVLALLTDGADHWYTAEEALAAGFIDEITAPVEVTASARFETERFKRIPAAAAAFVAHKEQSMPQTNPAAAQPATPAVAAQPVAAAPAAPAAPTAYVRSATETAEIRAMYGAFRTADGVQTELEEVLADTTVSPDAASRRLLAKLGAGATPARPAGAAPRIESLEDENDKRRGAAVSAILKRAGVEVKASELDGNPFRGYRMLDFARASLHRAGVKTDGMDPMQLVGAAFTQSTSDFPVILENAMYKSLMAAYMVTPDTWSRFCATGSVSDFRANPRYLLGSFSNLDSVNELGEFTNKSIPDGQKASVSIGTKGNIINLSRQAMINDDLGAFVGLAGMLGRAARRSIEADVYALLALNSGAGPTMRDGNALFHSSHGNLAGSGAVPSVSVLDAARQAMLLQKDISGNDFLDIRPAVALCGTAQGGNMRVINDAQYDPDTANKLQRPNQVRGMVRDVIDSPRTYLTSWYLFADPSEAPVIEVDFLDGNQQPFLDQQAGFDVDGTRYKVRLDYGVTAIDWRGAYRNPGA